MSIKFFEPVKDYKVHTNLRPDGVSLAQPDMDSIDICDIAYSLSRLARFNGHNDRRHEDEPVYSVAQHSVLVSRVTPRCWCKEALFHDAAEAYIGDLIRPVKLYLRQFTDAYDRLEEKFQRAIFKRFDLDFRKLGEVKPYDMAVYADEVFHLWAPNPDWDLPPRAGFEWEDLEPMSAHDAYWAFLDRADELDISF